MLNNFYALYGKRAFDLASASCAIVLLSPFMLLAALAVRLSGPGPVIFRHARVGRGFSHFSMYKFRTMGNGADKDGPQVTAAGDPRITAVGRLLRKTKLDELPQLFNVLKGEMSLVGPRPEVEKYVKLFEDDYKTVLSVRPGVTDYAAIEFRSEEKVLSRYADPEAAYRKEVLPAKIALYKKYIRGISLAADIGIIFRTFFRITAPR